MAIHLCRDYLTQNISTGNRTYIYPHILAIFLRRVLGYSYVGDTNYNINSIGSLLIATGDTTPTTAPTFPPGNKASINLGTQKEFYVSIPVGVRTVTGTDIGRILVLKSTSYPTFNSGLFVILGIDSTTNSYIIDYRTLGDHPPVEAADSLAWYLYEKDISCPVNAGPNSKNAGEYRSDSDSPTPRVLLQSPHSLAWQVRICNESTSDFATNNFGSTVWNCPQTSVAPGFGGNSAGDFFVFGQHFHAPMWYDSNAFVYMGGARGIGDGGGRTGTQFRVTMIGDDTGQGVVMYARSHVNSTQPTSFILCFGVADNEPLPLPTNNLARLFVLRTGFHGNDGFGQREINDGALQAEYLQPNPPGAQGMSATPFGTPCMCAASFWTYVTGVAQYNGPHFDSSATDSPFINDTELFYVDLVQASLTGWNRASFGTSSGTPVYPLAPRLMGTIPHLRYGRSNFGDFSPSTDLGRQYQHLRRGLYIPW